MIMCKEMEGGGGQSLCAKRSGVNQHVRRSVCVCVWGGGVNYYMLRGNSRVD